MKGTTDHDDHIKGGQGRNHHDIKADAIYVAIGIVAYLLLLLLIGVST